MANEEVVRASKSQKREKQGNCNHNDDVVIDDCNFRVKVKDQDGVSSYYERKQSGKTTWSVVKYKFIRSLEHW